jgi:acetolactate synthase I/II/III large subunit
MFCKKKFSLNNLRQLSTILKYQGLSGAQIVYKKLEENNVKNVFMYSGGAIMPLIDCFYKNNIKYYINSHEQNCGHAATGLSKSSNQTGVCVVTSGPGLTNLITPMLDATNDSTPLVVFSGQVPLKAMGSNAFQEAPSTEITKPITKWSYCVQDVSELPYVVDKAFWLANHKKKGSVHIDLPKCVLTSILEVNAKKFIKPKYNNSETQEKYLNQNIQNIAEIINNSKKPIFYIGKGCIPAYQELRYCAEEFKIPVTTTLHGMGIFDEEHELSCEMLGMHGSYTANNAIQQSDCIICVGARFDDRTTGNLDLYAPMAKKAFNENKGGIIHCDIEPKQIKAVVDSNYNIVCDSQKFLKKLSINLKYKNRENWLEKINDWKISHPFKYIKGPNLKAQEVLEELNNLIIDKENYIFTTGVGNHQMWTCQFIKWKYPKSIISSGSLGVMGAGLPYAIGAQIGNPDKNIILIDGDSSFNMTLTDLKTIKENKLPIKIIILNDGNQNMVRVWEQLFFEERITATRNFNNPDYALLAKSFGINSFVCDNRKYLRNSIIKLLSSNESILCEFKIESDKCFPLNPPGTALDNLILDSEKDLDSNLEIPS